MSNATIPGLLRKYRTVFPATSILNADVEEEYVAGASRITGVETLLIGNVVVPVPNPGALAVTVAVPAVHLDLTAILHIPPSIHSWESRGEW
jgi:hypothetical protein